MPYKNLEDRNAYARKWYHNHKDRYKKTKEYYREYYQNHKDKINEYIKQRCKENSKQWKNYFSVVYGDNPTCEICGKILNWVGEKSEVVHFDHKSGNEIIKGRPQKWYSSHRVTDKNKLTWNKCEFGILCNRCNKLLFSQNRKEWLISALSYTMKGGK